MASRRKIRYKTKNRNDGDDHCGINNKEINSHQHQHTDSAHLTVSSSWWSLLLHQTLECWIHQLLYLRQVYPSYTFVQQRQRDESLPSTNATSYPDSWDSDLYLDIRNIDGGYYHWNIHPQVNTYIETVLRTAVPSLISGVATELQFHVIQYFPPETTTTSTKSGHHPPSNYKNHNTQHQHPPYHILETFTIQMMGNRKINTDTTDIDNIPHPTTNTTNKTTTTHPTTTTTTITTTIVPLEVIQHVKNGMKYLIQSHIRTLECHPVITTNTTDHQNSHSMAHPNNHTTTTNNGSHPSNDALSFQLVLYVPPSSSSSSSTTTTRTTTTTTATFSTTHNDKTDNDGNDDVNEIQQALRSGTWYAVSRHPPEHDIIHIDDTQDDDDNDMKPSYSKENPTITPPPPPPPRTTIRPIVSYTEDHYLGIHIQCSMLRYSHPQPSSI